MKSVDVNEVLKILHKYERFIFVTDTPKYSSMVDEIANLKALKQEPNYKSFCEFVAKTIMEEDFELNAGANAEIFCRKLAKLGIVRVDGDSWILESEDKLTELEAEEDDGR